MTDQPEALRVADEQQRCFPKSGKKAARLLREQHAEIERLRAERKEDQGVIARWRGRTLRAEAETERLRADAGRYRWMKANVKRIPPAWELIGWDAAIRAAMREGER